MENTPPTQSSQARNARTAAARSSSEDSVGDQPLDLISGFSDTSAGASDDSEVAEEFDHVDSEYLPDRSGPSSASGDDSEGEESTDEDDSSDSEDSEVTLLTRRIEHRNLWIGRLSRFFASLRLQVQAARESEEAVPTVVLAGMCEVLEVYDCIGDIIEVSCYMVFHKQFARTRMTLTYSRTRCARFPARMMLFSHLLIS